MKTYNLTTGKLYRRIGDKDCYCALGIFAAEKGFPRVEIEADSYRSFKGFQYADDLAKMVEYLAPLVGWTPGTADGSNYHIVYDANDRKTGEGACDCSLCGDDKSEPPNYTVTADQIKEALRLAGIDVELNDMRGVKE